MHELDFRRRLCKGAEKHPAPLIGHRTGGRRSYRTSVPRTCSKLQHMYAIARGDIRGVCTRKHLGRETRADDVLAWLGRRSCRRAEKVLRDYACGISRRSGRALRPVATVAHGATPSVTHVQGCCAADGRHRRMRRRCTWHLMSASTLGRSMCMTPTSTLQGRGIQP